MIKERFDKSNSNFDRMKSHFDQQDERLDGLMEKARETRQRLTGLEQDTRESCLVTEADVPTGEKTRKRAEDAAADQAKDGDNCPAKRGHTGPTSSTSFGMTAEPPALSRRDDVLVNKGAEVPKSHLPPMEVRILPSAIGGLLPAGTGPTVMRTIFLRPLFSWNLSEETKKSNSRINNRLASYCWKRVIQTKSRQTLMFNRGGFKDRLRACPFLGGWHVLLCEEVFVGYRMVSEAGEVFGSWMTWNIISERGTSDSLCRTYCG